MCGLPVNKLCSSLLPSNVDAMFFMAGNKLPSSTSTVLVQAVPTPNEARRRAIEEEGEEESNPPQSILFESEESDQDSA